MSQNQSYFFVSRSVLERLGVIVAVDSFGVSFIGATIVVVIVRSGCFTFA